VYAMGSASRTAHKVKSWTLGSGVSLRWRTLSRGSTSSASLPLLREVGAVILAVYVVKRPKTARRSEEEMDGVRAALRSKSATCRRLVIYV